MEIRLLRAFLTVTNLRHFGRAAEALHLSQPALSKQIVALEASLGGRLFERGRHGAGLTAFGETFLPDAEALVRDADDVLARAREASSGQRGHLRIGLCLSTLTLAPPLIAAYRAQHPQIGVTLNDLSSAEQTRRMFAGKLDVGFVRLPAAAGLSAFAVIDESLALAVPRHAKWKRLPAKLDEFNELGFIALARSKGPGTAAMIDAWCAGRGFVPRVIQQADDFQSVLAAVAAGVGVAFVPSRAEHLLRDAKVLRLKDASAQWRVGLAWQTERDDPVVARFVDYVRAATKHGAAAPVTA
ncbi:LysR family transcriptional regulator [Paraburkholderia caribensis]|uniref:LysR family transcriptional regulator n=1 Tax=Paraburkholderia caribensis TaxID=75105 RepID=UPI00072092C3|nr:LysR substrate-binding domain-containing protein [Paraburkholderia caribensis]ALP63066.1 LysR family transcriptional regulator [Paraburkholderia caribensis]AUT51697.1 LysR family transcriptional regulator [Paraburkholderia caribensis]